MKELSAEELSQRCDPKRLGFKVSDKVKVFPRMIEQVVQ